MNTMAAIDVLVNTVGGCDVMIYDDNSGDATYSSRIKTNMFSRQSVMSSLQA